MKGAETINSLVCKKVYSLTVYVPYSFVAEVGSSLDPIFENKFNGCCVLVHIPGI